MPISPGSGGGRILARALSTAIFATIDATPDDIPGISITFTPNRATTVYCTVPDCGNGTAAAGLNLRLTNADASVVYDNVSPDMPAPGAVNNYFPTVFLSKSFPASSTPVTVKLQGVAPAGTGFINVFSNGTTRLEARED